MYTVTEIYSRDEMIAFGHSLGRALKANKRRRPWMVLLDGDPASGKSLIALAVYQQFNPHRFRGTLPDRSKLKAEIELSPHRYSILARKIVFHNHVWAEPLDKDRFHDKLDNYSKRSSKSRVCFVSNLVRSGSNHSTGPHDYELNGLDSDQVDMHVFVKELPGRFSRRISLTYSDPKLAPLATTPPSRLAGLLPRAMFGRGKPKSHEVPV